jgi:hypothetical protein
LAPHTQGEENMIYYFAWICLFSSLFFLFNNIVAFFVSLAGFILFEILYHKMKDNRRIAKIEAESKKRISLVDKNKELWLKMSEMLKNDEFPHPFSPAWWQILDACRLLDRECAQHNLVDLKLEPFFHDLSNISHEKRMAREIYNFHWGQILGMIREMNFPQKGSDRWELLLMLYDLADEDYYKNFSEKGSLVETFKRMTEGE